MIASLLLGCSADDAREPELDGAPRGVHPELPLAEDLDGLASHQGNKIETTNGGAAYIQECRSLGVPVPEYVLESAGGFTWTNHGEVLSFLTPPGELWTWESADPDGVCMALPRWRGDDAQLLGVICLGRATSTTCFWDNPNGTEFPRGQAIPIGDFVGGFDLEANGQGTCSDCHAGENPFVVHPDDPAFADAKATVDIFPSAWPTPVVPAVPAMPWPGNPGPIEKLGSIGDGEQRCDTCHQKGGPGGRFPLISSALSQYCSLVLQSAVDPVGTMPPKPLSNDFDITDYATHRDWLMTACKSAPGEIEPVTPPGAITLGPPIIEEPLYGCAEHVVVSGARQGAEVSLKLDGQSVPSETFQGLQVVFDLAEPLAAGDKVRAIQEFQGAKSEEATVEVRDYRDDYPNGLPPPEITPVPIYACATAIAVRNVPGVELLTEKQTSQGVETYKHHTGVDHTWVGGLGSSFQVGDQLTVRQSLCGDASGPSETEVVEAAPTSVQAPTFEPSLLVAGQSFVNLNQIEQGLAVSVDELNGGGLLWFDSSVPYNSFRGIEVGFTLSTQDELSAAQFLCDGSGQSASMSVSACDGSVLADVLSIAQPQDGDDFVLVTEGIPSATIRVLAKDKELGSGSGYVIGLNRSLVSGELISVVQELKGCSADSAFVIAVL